jgi:hypothetical protein
LSLFYIFVIIVEVLSGTLPSTWFGAIEPNNGDLHKVYKLNEQLSFSVKVGEK